MPLALISGEGKLKREEKEEEKGTMVESRKKHRQNSHQICPTSEGVSEVSERANE